MNIKELFDQGYTKEQIEDLVLTNINAEYKARQEADSKAQLIENARTALVDAMVAYAKAIEIATDEDEAYLRSLTTEAFKLQERELRKELQKAERPKSRIVKTENPDEVIAKFLRGLK